MVAALRRWLWVPRPLGAAKPETRGDARRKPRCGQVRRGPAPANPAASAAPAVPAALTVKPTEKPQGARLRGGRWGTRVAGVAAAGPGARAAASECLATNGTYLLGGNSIVELFSSLSLKMDSLGAPGWLRR